MIPRIVHRIWLDDPMPDEFEEYGRRWAELHPDWEVWDWRDSAALPRLSNQALFDKAKKIVPNDWKRFQADLLRLELLWLHGGVYADCDVEPLRPFDPLLNREAFAAWSPNKYQGRHILTQAVLGSVPMHPFFHWCIAGIPDAVKQYRRRPLAQMVGPHHVQRVYDEHPEGLTVFESKMFYPQSNLQRDKGLTPNLGDSFAWHRWANSRDRRHSGVRTETTGR